MARIREGALDDRESITEAHVASVRGVEESVYSDGELAVWASGAAATAYALDDPATVNLTERGGRSTAPVT